MRRGATRKAGYGQIGEDSKAEDIEPCGYKQGAGRFRNCPGASAQPSRQYLVEALPLADHENIDSLRFFLDGKADPVLNLVFRKVIARYAFEGSVKHFAGTARIEENFIDVGIENFFDKRFIKLFEICFYLRVVLVVIEHRGESLPWSAS